MRHGRSLVTRREGLFTLIWKKILGRPNRQSSSSTTNRINYTASENKMPDTKKYNRTPLSPKEKVKYFVASVFVLLLVGMLLFLTFVDVPTGNRDLIVTIVAAFTTGGSMAMAFLFGSSEDAEKEKMSDEMEELRNELAKIKSGYEHRLTRLQSEYDLLNEKYTRLTDKLVSLHVIEKDGMKLVKDGE